MGDLKPAETVVRGVVEAGGPGAANFSDEECWRFHFSIQPWRDEGGTVQMKPLTIFKMVQHAEVDQLMNAVDAYQVIRLRVRNSSDTEAELSEILGVVDDDSELNDAAARLQEPQIYQDETFGALTLDRTVDWFEGRINWDGTEVNLALTPNEDGALEPTIQVAKVLWDDHSAWAKRIREFATGELLSLKNASWLDEDEAEVSPDDFSSRMVLESVVINADGTFEFTHTDGDLFWGHSIQVSGDIENGPEAADIAG